MIALPKFQEERRVILQEGTSNGFSDPQKLPSGVLERQESRSAASLLLYSGDALSANLLRWARQQPQPSVIPVRWYSVQD